MHGSEKRICTHTYSSLSGVRLPVAATLTRSPRMSIDRFPLDASSRAALREAHLIRAVRSAAQEGLSLLCVSGDHAIRPGDSRDGCTNDGSNCLCWCHDQEKMGDESLA